MRDLTIQVTQRVKYVSNNEKIANKNKKFLIEVDQSIELLFKEVNILGLKASF